MLQTDRLLLLVPAAMALHNLEEYAGMESYARRRGLAVGRRQVQVALALATLLPAVVAGVGVASPPRSRRKRAGLAMAGLMLANALSHTSQTLFFRDLSPGTWSALVLLLPLGLRLADQAERDGYISRNERSPVLALGAASMVPSALLLQGLGWLAERLALLSAPSPGARVKGRPAYSTPATSYP